MRYDDLAGLSPVVRKEVLTGELSRRVKSLDVVAVDDVASIVEALVNISLSEVLQCIEDPSKLKDQVDIIATRQQKQQKQPEPQLSRSASTSQDSRLLDSQTLNATASAPDHPSTPISVSVSSSPPRTSSPSGSVAPHGNERDRIMAAIGKLESSRQDELTELIMSLPKRERAMCLFNNEVLRAKLADAKMVLEISDEEEDKKKNKKVDTPPASQAVPVTPKKAAPQVADLPHTPDLSSRGPSATASPLPATPGNPSSTHTIASLARLPAAEVIRLATSSSATGLPLPKADPLVVQATDEFIDGLLDKPLQAQKQQLGDKL